MCFSRERCPAHGPNDYRQGAGPSGKPAKSPARTCRSISLRSPGFNACRSRGRGSMTLAELLAGPRVRIPLPPAKSHTNLTVAIDLANRGRSARASCLLKYPSSRTFDLRRSHRQTILLRPALRCRGPPAESPQTIGSSAAERDLCSARDEPALRRRPLALALVTTVAVL